MTEKLKLPENVSLIKKIMLTSNLIWDDKLSLPQINNWLSNFTGEVFSIEKEKHLALWLLSNFVYYNNKEVKHLCKILYSDFIHSEAIFYNNLGLSRADLIKKIIQETKFLNLGKSGESGGLISYYFRTESDISVNDFLTDIKDVEETTSHIVFVDDVTLSGSQASRKINTELKKINFSGRISNLTMIASTNAIQKLNSSNISVISSVTLSDRNQAFNENSNVFSFYPDIREDSKKMAEHYGNKIYNEHPLGWKDGQYLFGFAYNTPNNTLPIFWSKTKGWIPIVKRTEKNYEETAYDRVFI